MTEVSFVIPGTPIPMMAPRLSRNGGAYNPRSKEKQASSWQLRTQSAKLKWEGPIEIDYNFEMPVPKSWSAKKKEAALDEKYHTVKPDADNLMKFYGDLLKDFIFVDDAQVCSIRCKKYYSQTPQTKITVRRCLDG